MCHVAYMKPAAYSMRVVLLQPVFDWVVSPWGLSRVTRGRLQSAE